MKNKFVGFLAILLSSLTHAYVVNGAVTTALSPVVKLRKGSGVYIRQNVILTSAHVVLDNPKYYRSGIYKNFKAMEEYALFQELEKEENPFKDKPDLKKKLSSIKRFLPTGKNYSAISNPLDVALVCTREASDEYYDIAVDSVSEDDYVLLVGFPKDSYWHEDPDSYLGFSYGRVKTVGITPIWSVIGPWIKTIGTLENTKIVFRSTRRLHGNIREFENQQEKNNPHFVYKYKVVIERGKKYNVITYPVDSSSDTAYIYPSIESGDSGGAMLRRNSEKGTYEVVGLLTDFDPTNLREHSALQANVIVNQTLLISHPIIRAFVENNIDKVCL